MRTWTVPYFVVQKAVADGEGECHGPSRGSATRTRRYWPDRHAPCIKARKTVTMAGSLGQRQEYWYLIPVAAPPSAS